MNIYTLLRNNSGLITLGIFLSLLSTASTLLLPALVSQLLLGVGSGEVRKPLVLLVLAILATAVFTAFTMYTTSVAADRAVRDLRKKITNHLLYLHMKEFEKVGAGGFTTRVTTDTSVISTAASSTLVDFVGGITVIIGALVYMAVIDWKLLFVVLVVLSIALVIIIVISSSLQSLSSRVQDHLAALGSILQSSLSAFRTIKAFRSESKVIGRLDNEIDHAYRNRRKMSFIEATLDPLSTVASYIALITVALFGSIRLSNGDLSAESLTTFVTALFLMLAPVVQVTQSFGTFFEAKGALNRVNRLFDLKVEDPCKVTSDSPSTIPLSGSIELDSVSYHSDDRVIIDNVSLSVKEGEKIALTGASGSGKTTIFSLLLNLYDVSSGHIRIGGRDLKHWSKKELRSMVTYVEQEPDLLPGTLRENLTLGSHQLPSDNTLISLLKKFGLEKFSSPAGLERLVGFENSGLSGGERQRVAIIRAIVQQSSIILVDEPTSALDSESAKLAMDSLLNTTATVIFTSHDPEVVDLADKSFVVSDGKLFEDALFNRRMFNE